MANLNLVLPSTEAFEELKKGFLVVNVEEVKIGEFENGKRIGEVPGVKAKLFSLNLGESYEIKAKNNEPLASEISNLKVDEVVHLLEFQKLTNVEKRDMKTNGVLTGVFTQTVDYFVCNKFKPFAKLELKPLAPTTQGQVQPTRQG